MAGEQAEFTIVSNTAKAVSNLGAFDKALDKTAANSAARSDAIKRSLESINNVKLRGKLLGGLESDLSKAQATAGKAGAAIKTSMGSIAAPSMRSTAAIAGLAGGLAAMGIQAAVSAIKGGVQAFMDWSDAASGIDAKLALATDKFGSLAQAQDDVRAIAASSRSDLEATTALYSSMALQATSLGISQKDVATATSTVGKALKISGADAASSAGAIRQLGQALGSGKLSGDEFNSIAEASPRLMQLFSDALGKPRGELKKLAGEGKLTADVLLKGLTDPKLVAGIEREFGKIPVTFADMKTALGNAAIDIAGALQKGLGAGSSMTGFLTSVQHATKSALPLFQAIGGAIGGLLGIIGNLVKGVVSIWSAFNSGGPGSLTTVERLTLAFNLVGEAASVVSNLIGQYFTAVASIITSVVGTVRGLFGDLFTWLVGDASVSTQSVGQSFIGILRAVKFVANSIPKLFKSAFNAVTGIFSVVGKAIQAFFNGNFNAFDGLGGQISAQLKGVKDDVANVGKEALKIAQDQKANQAAIDRLTGRTKGKRDAAKPQGPKAAPIKDDKKDKKSDAEKAKETAAKKYADAVAKLKANLQDLQVTEEQKALLDALESAGLERKIDLTGEQADTIRDLVKQIDKASKRKSSQKALDDMAEATRELSYSEEHLAIVEARRRAGLPTDLSNTAALTGVIGEMAAKIDAAAVAQYRLNKAKEDAKAAKDIQQDLTRREDEANAERDAIANPDGNAELKRQLMELDRQSNAEKARIMALEVITLQQRQQGMQGILQSEKDALVAANERITTQEKANVVAQKQAELASSLADTMVNLFNDPAATMKAFFQDLMKRLLEAILKAALLGEKLGGSGGIGGLLGSVFKGAIGARASGGSVRKGEGYTFNEKGQEAFFPGRAGEVLTASKTKKALSGGGSGVTLAPTYNITLSGNSKQDNATLAVIKSNQAEQNRAVRAQNNKRGWQ